MATVETPRSARRRQITADVKQIGVDLAGGVLDSLAARAPGPIGQLRALLGKLDLVTVDSIFLGPCRGCSSVAQESPGRYSLR